MSFPPPPLGNPLPFVVWLTLLFGSPVLAEPPVADDVARIEQLRDEIARHDDLYFRKATPAISDQAYDRLKQELEGLLAKRDGQSADLAIGDDRQPGFERRPHRARMLSLDKAYSDEALERFVSELPSPAAGESNTLLVEPKLDGAAVSLTYVGGKLVHALSRGNGREGDDVTMNVRAIANVPQHLHASPEYPFPDVLEVRGEVVLAWSELDRLNAERVSVGEPSFAHPRNVAAGSLRLGDPEAVAQRGLSVVVHSLGAIEPESVRPRSMRKAQDQWRAWGFTVVATDVVAGDPLTVVDAVARRQVANRGFRYPTDGVVVKVDDLARQQRAGESPSAPRWAIARKFPTPPVTTIVRAIRWEPGRTGRLTPVAEVEPVSVGGSIVSRVSLHNAGELARRDVRTGDTVAVERAGGVIPSIATIDLARRPAASVPEPVPATCPSCMHPLDTVGGSPLCSAHRCPAKLQRRIEHFAGPAGLGLSGLGPALIAQLIERDAVNDVADLYCLRGAELPAADAERILAAMECSRLAPFDRWLTALGLPGVGPARARQLAAGLGSFEGVASATPEEFEATGLSPSAAATLHAALQQPEWRETFAALINLGIQPATATAE